MDLKSRAYISLILSLITGSLMPVLLTITNKSNMIEIFLLASLLSIPFGLLIVFRNKKSKNLMELVKNRKRLFYVAFAGLLVYAPFLYGVAYAEQYVPVPLAAVIFRTYPLLMLFFLPSLLRERLTKSQVVALVLAFIGILIGITGGNVLTSFSNPDVPLIILLVLMALGYAFGLVIIRWQKLDNDTLISAASFVLSAFFGLLFIGTGGHFVPLNSTDGALIIYIAVTNIIGFYTFFYAFKTLKTTIFTNLASFSAFLTFSWAAIILSQPIRIYYLVIAALVGLGVLIQRSDQQGSAYRFENPTKYMKKLPIFDVTEAFQNGRNLAIKEAIKSGSVVLAFKVESKHR